MKILSFGSTGGHDTAAALVCDGSLVAAAEEERFTRRKHDGDLPVHAIEYCLSTAGLRMQDIEVIAYPDRPFRTGADSQMSDMPWDLLWSLNRAGVVRHRAFIHKALLSAWLRLPGVKTFNAGMSLHAKQTFERLHQAFGVLPPVRFYDHHLAHAAAAFLTSGLDRAAVVTIDGRGASYATVVWNADRKLFKRLHAESWLNSLGLFYARCTIHVALGEFGQGKLMGLAPYGNPEVFRSQASEILDTQAARFYRVADQPLETVFGFKRRTTEPILAPPYTDFAAAVQKAVEQAILRVVRIAMDACNCRDVCLGGGVSLNCSANGALLAAGSTRALWLFPAAGDNGLPVGAALLAALEVGDSPPTQQLTDAYLGPSFTEQQCLAALEKVEGVHCSRSPAVASDTARLLASGAVVGWFQGRMELGPRALGNRSILADPRNVEIRDRVNRIKGRELWRPLAPSVLAERAHEFFELNGQSPFMLIAVQVRSEKRGMIPAVVHVDGSARPQTVSRQQNAAYHELITAFARQTGVPIVLNTSFNDASEPIVCSPGDAVRTFLANDLDALVMGSLIVTKRPLHELLVDGTELPRHHVGRK